MNEILNNVYHDLLAWLPKFGAATVILIFFVVLAATAQKLIRSLGSQWGLARSLIALMVRTLRVLLLSLGFITAMGTLGVNVSALVAGLGLTGFAIGFALKDTISNLLSGILILLYQPFEIGDQIKTSGYEGTVSSIDLRYTQLVFEGTKILIPNSKLFTEPVTIVTPESIPK